MCPLTPAVASPVHSYKQEEGTKHVIGHVLSCLAVTPKPKILKKDNGLGYISSSFKQFCAQMSIRHITGIPNNSQGQGIVERTHQTLKNMLFKLQSGGEEFYILTLATLGSS